MLHACSWNACLHVHITHSVYYFQNCVIMIVSANRNGYYLQWSQYLKWSVGIGCYISGSGCTQT